MLQASVGPGPVPTSEQGHVAFEYANLRSLCPGRSGYGPLTVALDTNVLIDYVQAAGVIWGAPAAIQPAEWTTREAALRDLMTVWCWRDLRFWVFERQLTDARRGLDADRHRTRAEILGAFVSDAVERASWGRRDPLPTPRSLIAAGRLPDGADRDLVEEALGVGCDVFLTEDDKVLKCDALLAPHGLRVLRTRELLEALLAMGELEERRSLCGVVPDNHGMTHLMRNAASDEARRLLALADA
jgi:hypothetical protein